MHSAKESIRWLEQQASAALWSMPAAVLLLAVLPAFFVLNGGLRWALAILLLVLSLGLAFRARSSLGKLCASLQEAAQQAEAEDEKQRQQILDLQETCRQMEIGKRKAGEERHALERRIAEEETRTTAALQQADSFKQERDHLLADYRRFGQELSEAKDRRRLWETRNQDLERRLREVETASAGSFGKLKEYEQEVVRLKEGEQALRVENNSFRQTLARQQRELEVAGQERSAAEDRLSKLKQELDAFKARAEGAEERVRYLESDLPKQAEFVARKQTEKLLQEEQAKNGELELRKTALESKIQEHEQKAAQAEQLIKELHKLLEDRLAETKSQMADHFVWKTNFFHEKEITLDFVNGGVPVHLISTTSQPALTIESPVGRHLGRNESATIRFSSKANLPHEFLVRVRLAAFTQEASFRIRPFAEPKIERL